MQLEIYGGAGSWCAHGEYEPERDPKLLPCPFCGSTQLEVSNTHTPCYTVSCECGAEMHGESTHRGRIRTKSRCAELHAEAQHAAIDAWNQRRKTR